VRLVGADAEAALAYRDADLRGPLAIVVGSEGRGLSGPIRRRLDLAVRIPMRGHVASPNAAVAGSVLLLEAAGQRAPEPSDAAAEVEPALARDAPPTEEAAAEAARPTKRGRPARRKKTGGAPVGSDDLLA
jgi:tRNA C32,U32 (ribose-2'-O)-methylase TrmJ